MRSFPYLGVAAFSLAVVGCGVPQEPVEQEDALKESDAVAGELTAKASGITVWLEPTLRPTTRFDQPAWVIAGRTSKNIEAVFSFSSDDEFAEAVQVSPRKFEIYMDAPQAAHLLAGYRLLLDLDTVSGAKRQYFASFRIAPRFDDFHGSSKITLHKTITPFVFGQEIRFRNLIGVSAGYTSPMATTEAGAAPLAIGPLGSGFAMDWSGDAIVASASDLDQEITVTAQKGSQIVSRFQQTELYVSSFQLIDSGMPLEVWPDPSCTPAVRSCLQALPTSELDRSSCGPAVEVNACVNEVAVPVDAARFQANLSSHLVGWYADHGADVAASGGNSLAEAQALCSAAKVEEVTNPEEDPDAHDLTQFRVFRHPDVVWPGSDIVWFGAYEKSTGALVAIYDFN